jgi:hypothetical protein
MTEAVDQTKDATRHRGVNPEFEEACAKLEADVAKISLAIVNAVTDLGKLVAGTTDNKEVSPTATRTHRHISSKISIDLGYRLDCDTGRLIVSHVAIVPAQMLDQAAIDAEIFTKLFKGV